MKPREAKMHQAKILKEQHLKQSEIACALGVSERMVRYYLSDDNASPHTRKQRPSFLDPYKDFIDSVLDDAPHYNLIRLKERLEPMGYSGGMTILREYAALARNALTVKAALRFETEPGAQSQVDWKEAGRMLIDGKERKVYAFVLLLGYSRRAFVRFTLDMKSPTLLACHLKAFEYFGGLTKEILYDNMKTAWLYSGGAWETNPSLLRFASETGFKPLRCKVRRPETKGKVERFIGYLGNNFLPMARERGLGSLEALNEAALEWLEKVDAKEVRDFCETRNARFAVEGPLLKPFSMSYAPDIRCVHDLVVSREGLITFEGNRYSVPARLIGMTVQLKPDPLSMNADLCANGVRLRTIHRAQSGSRARIVLPEDRKELYELWVHQHRTRENERASPPNHAPRMAEIVMRHPRYYDSFVERALS